MLNCHQTWISLLLIGFTALHLWKKKTNLGTKVLGEEEDWEKKEAHWGGLACLMKTWTCSDSGGVHYYGSGGAFFYFC
jgi:hypothetical protein